MKEQIRIPAFLEAYIPAHFEGNSLSDINGLKTLISKGGGIHSVLQCRTGF